MQRTLITARIRRLRLLLLYRVHKACRDVFELATRVFALPDWKPQNRSALANGSTDRDNGQYQDDTNAALGTESRRHFVQTPGLAISDESSPFSQPDESEGSEQVQALPRQQQVCPCPRTAITSPGSFRCLIVLGRLLHNREGFPDMVMGSRPIRQMNLDRAVTFLQHMFICMTQRHSDCENILPSLAASLGLGAW
jgi:hypothetical protein